MEVTLTEIITAVTGFVSSYGVFIAAGLVVGVAGAAVTRLIRSGR